MAFPTSFPSNWTQADIERYRETWTVRETQGLSNPEPWWVANPEWAEEPLTLVEGKPIATQAIEAGAGITGGRTGEQGVVAPEVSEQPDFATPRTDESREAELKQAIDYSEKIKSGEIIYDPNIFGGMTEQEYFNNIADVQAKYNVLQQAKQVEQSYRDASVEIPPEVKANLESAKAVALSPASPFIKLTPEGSMSIISVLDAEKAGIALSEFEKIGFSPGAVERQRIIETLNKYPDLSAAIRDGKIEVIRRAQQLGILAAEQVVDAQSGAAEVGSRLVAQAQLKDFINEDGTLKLAEAIKAGIDGSVIRNAGYEVSQGTIESIKHQFEVGELVMKATSNLSDYTKDGGKSYDLFRAILGGHLEDLKKMSSDSDWQNAVMGAQEAVDDYLLSLSQIPTLDKIEDYPKRFDGFTGFQPVDDRNVSVGRTGISTGIPTGYVGYYYENGVGKQIKFKSLNELKEWERKAKEAAYSWLERGIANLTGRPIETVDVSPSGVLNALSYPEMQLVFMGTMLPEASAGLTAILSKIPQPILIAATAGQTGLGIQQTVVNWNYMTNMQRIQALGITITPIVAMGLMLRPLKPNVATAEYQRSLINKVVDPHNNFVDGLIKDPAKAAEVNNSYAKLVETTNDLANVQLQLKQAQKVINDIGFPKNQYEVELLKQAQVKIDMINGTTPLLDIPSTQKSTALRLIVEKPANLLERIKLQLRTDAENYNRALADAMKVDDPSVLREPSEIYNKTVIDIDNITSRIVDPRNPEVLTNEMVGILREKEILLDNIKKSTDPQSVEAMNKLMMQYDKQLLELANENFANFIGDGKGIQKLLIENNRKLESLNEKLKWVDDSAKVGINGEIRKVEANIKILENMKILLEQQTFEGIQKYTEPIYGKESYGEVLRKLNDVLAETQMSEEDVAVFNWKVRDTIIKNDVKLLKEVMENLRLKAGETSPELAEGLNSRLKQIETESNQLIESKQSSPVDMDESLFKSKQDIVDHQGQIKYAEEHLGNVRSPDKRSAIEDYIKRMKEQVEKKKLDLATREKIDIDWFKIITPEEAEKLPKPAIREEGVSKPKTDIERRIIEAEREMARESVRESIARPYRVVTPSRTYKETREHIGAMTPEQARRLYGEDIQIVAKGIPIPLSIGKPIEWLSPEQFTEQIVRIREFEQPSVRPIIAPDVETMPLIETMPATETKTETKPTAKPETELRISTIPATETKTETKPETELKISTITTTPPFIGTPSTPFIKPSFISPPIDFEESEEINEKLKWGFITWRQGKAYYAIPQREDGSFNFDDKLSSGKPFRGTTKFATGKGSAYKTMQYVGNNPPEKTNIDLGFAQFTIVRDGSDVKIQQIYPDESANWDGTNRYTTEEALAEKEQGIRKESLITDSLDLTFTTNTPEGKEMWFDIIDNGKIVGKLIVVDEEESVYVRDIQVDPEYRMKGVALESLDEVSELLGKPLDSSSVITASGRALQESLSSEEMDEIVGSVIEEIEEVEDEDVVSPREERIARYKRQYLKLRKPKERRNVYKEVDKSIEKEANYYESSYDENVSRYMGLEIIPPQVGGKL